MEEYFRVCVLCEDIRGDEDTCCCQKCDSIMCHECTPEQPKYMYTYEEDCDFCKRVQCHHIIFNECPMCTSNSEYAEVDDLEIVNYLLKRYNLNKEDIKKAIAERRSSQNEITPIDIHKECVDYSFVSYLFKCMTCKEILHIDGIHNCERCYKNICQNCVKKLPEDAYEYDENCEHCKVFECSDVRILNCQKCLDAEKDEDIVTEKISI